MSLDPNAAEFLEQIAGVVPSLPRLDDEAGLAMYFEAPDGDVDVRIYQPEGQSLPVIVFFHGGVFIMGGLEMHDPVLRRLANAIPAVIVSVDYRLAPASVFPAAADDAFAALQWAATHAEEVGGDPRRVAVMGDSAGGALAAVTAIRFTDPWLSRSCRPPSPRQTKPSPSSPTSHAPIWRRRDRSRNRQDVNSTRSRVLKRGEPCTDHTRGGCASSPSLPA